MGERPSQPGPSDLRRQNNYVSSSPFTSIMTLFGGRTANPKSASNSSSDLGWGRPGAASSARAQDERYSLISGSDDFDDSDAISLLSNIANRDSRRGRTSAAARRRARARARTQRRTCTTLFFDLEDGFRALSCGLLGSNAAGSDADAPGTQRAASIRSVMSRGARGSNLNQASSSGVVRVRRHSRSLSDASTDSGGSLVSSGFAESCDQDAGMLDDTDIARFGQPTSQAASSSHALDATAASTMNAKAEAEAKAKNENEKARKKAEVEEEAEKAKQEAAERQKALELEAARLKAEAEAEATLQAEEEARLAAAEEAAIAKARRKAERKAAKAGLLKLQHETQTARSKGWRTEAEAEAAAGGFGLADAEEEGVAEQYEGRHFGDYNDGLPLEHELDQGEYGQYGDAEEASGDDYTTIEERGSGQVVHHHHYYHAAPQYGPEQFSYLSPHSGVGVLSDAPPLDHQHNLGAQNQPEPVADADKTVSEDEADIAGLSFGRKKSRRRRGDNDGSISGSRSGTGLTPRLVPSHTTGGSSSGGSANELHATYSASSSSSSGKAHYRDRSRRHERTSSKSSNSSAGIFSYQSSNLMHPHHPPPPPSTVATSIASPGSGLPNLYESEAIYVKQGMDLEGQHVVAQGAGDVDEDEDGDGDAGDVVASQFGKPNVVSDEFGVITAGTNKGGAGRVKKSYRDKRAKRVVIHDDVKQHAKDRFEGFPGF
ncbi:uncharacterized protein MEPE_01726 [Melanopsichium pennsylvanicum]|uniref:Uncharacterized protein n=1 Tax=Melanopsichium pennsylvanicum TaxID=63383 RepID=A0AAJ4XIY7_9BASI|nr:uncharacterized protein MEPE_01726 [Melanopsichium pennsylvanicum]